MTLVPPSNLACPESGRVKEETRPTGACQWFHACERCTSVLGPKPGDCCMFCSYGTNIRPSKQADPGVRCC